MVIKAPTAAVKKLLSYYEADSPKTKANLQKLLMHGRLGGSGKMIILPVDQGFEHGPDRSFAVNPEAYDPHYLLKLGVDAGVSAFAGPLGMLEATVKTFGNKIPFILKMNSANSLSRFKEDADQAVTATIQDALRLKCAGIGFTLYPGSDAQFSMIEQLQLLSSEAKANGLVVVVWCYPRGGDVSKEGETALDIISYSAHMAALLGAHIIKVKLPSKHLEQPEAKKAIESAKIKITELSDRVAHVVKCSFAGRRIVLFSGGATKGVVDVLTETKAIQAGGGHGSIIGRNCFQRPRTEALKLLDDMTKIYLGKK